MKLEYASSHSIARENMKCSLFNFPSLLNVMTFPEIVMNSLSRSHLCWKHAKHEFRELYQNFIDQFNNIIKFMKDTTLALLHYLVQIHGQGKRFFQIYIRVPRKNFCRDLNAFPGDFILQIILFNRKNTKISPFKVIH